MLDRLEITSVLHLSWINLNLLIKVRSFHVELDTKPIGMRGAVFCARARKNGAWILRSKVYLFSFNIYTMRKFGGTSVPHSHQVQSRAGGPRTVILKRDVRSTSTDMGNITYFGMLQKWNVDEVVACCRKRNRLRVSLWKIFVSKHVPVEVFS